MALAVVLVFLSLLLPLLVGIGASPDTDNFDKWTDGYFVHLGIEIVGPWLGYWMTFAGKFSCPSPPLTSTFMTSALINSYDNEYWYV